MAEPVVAVRGIPQSQYNEQVQQGIAYGQGGGKFSLKDSIKKHPTAWALGGAGVLVFIGIIVYMYNQNQANQQGVTSTDTTGLDSSTTGVSSTDQGVPYQNTGAIADQSAVLQAIQNENNSINQVLAALNGQQSTSTASSTGTNPQSSTSSAGTTQTQTATPVQSSPSWTSQNTPGESQAQIEKAYQGCVANCEATSINCKGKKKGTASCTTHCQEKCAARHPVGNFGGGYLDGIPTSRFILPSSSLSHQSMYYRPPIYGDAMSRVHYRHLRTEE